MCAQQPQCSSRAVRRQVHPSALDPFPRCHPTRPQGLYNEMKFDHPSRIQATTLPMILTPDKDGVYRDLIAQACGESACCYTGGCSTSSWALLGPTRAPRQPHPRHLPQCTEKKGLHLKAMMFVMFMHPHYAGTQWQRQDHMLRAGDAQQVGKAALPGNACLQRGGSKPGSHCSLLSMTYNPHLRMCGTTLPEWTHLWRRRRRCACAPRASWCCKTWRWCAAWPSTPPSRPSARQTRAEAAAGPGSAAPSGVPS